ncbi:hypothetical protein DFJ74DRAFT_704741 [Hyaloraphidium curvatum]|nr:hypothetical protein DFJ74DRAFT_704741 [Hyaloraphidium curvatum]
MADVARPFGLPSPAGSAETAFPSAPFPRAAVPTPPPDFPESRRPPRMAAVPRDESPAHPATPPTDVEDPAVGARDGDAGAPHAAPPLPPRPAKPDVGIDHWNRRRAEWTKNHAPPELPPPQGPPSSRYPFLDEITPQHFDSVYSSLVTAQRRFTRPMPLDFVTAVLVHGWKREGLFADAAEGSSLQ